MTLMLMLFWIILNGRFDGDVLITGAAITVVFEVCLCLFGGWSIKAELRVYGLIPKGVCYLGALIKEIVIANLVTIKIIFRKTEEPYIRTFQTPLKTKAACMVLANSITLTPGTVTVQLNDNVLTVHALTKELADGLDGSADEKRLIEMEEKTNGTGV